MIPNKPQKPIGSISLDLDNQWSYMKIHGDNGWEKYPSYFAIFVPLVLDLLDDMGLKITFFIVGQDAVLDQNKEYLQEIVNRGHEVGNHSFNHESWLQSYSREEIEAELDRAEEAISGVCGQKLNGFRGPGFSWSTDLLYVLQEREYLYDASTLPTYIGPLARLYYFSKSRLSREEREERSELFGTVADGMRPVKPYYWYLTEDHKLLEIPVTTMPGIKIPFHLSYLLYLSQFSNALMDLYLNTAIQFCRLTGTGPSFLLHPLDLVGGDQIKEMSFFPGMEVAGSRKSEVFIRVIGKLLKSFDLNNMTTHANYLIENNNLVLRKMEKGR